MSTQVQSKIFSVILYEYPNLNDVDLYCKEHLNSYQYAFILHDKDIDDNGNLKKEHYHLVMLFQKKVSINVIAKLCNVNVNLVQVKDSFIKSVRYLTHLDHPNKHFYEVDLIESNFDYLKFFDENILLLDSDIIDNIINYIYSYDVNLKQLLSYVLSNNYLSVYRKYYNIIKDVLYFKRLEEIEEKEGK